MSNKKIKNEIFAMYFVAKKLLAEHPNSEYWIGSASQAWHTIFMLNLADEYFKWEKENAQYYE